MVPSRAAFDLIMEFESISLTAYNCPAGHATIGYGHKLHNGPVTFEDQKIEWTVDRAREELEKDVAAVAKAVSMKVRVQLNQNQFDSLVSWAFNLGIGKLNEGTCTWLRELNKGNYKAVPPEIERWKFAGGKELPGLARRRKREAELFEKPYPSEE